LGNAVISILINLAKITCLIVLASYLFSRTKYFSELMERHNTLKNHLFTISFFGILSIFGTLGAVEMHPGAAASISDLGPLIAGLFGGPLIGLGAGLIGGILSFFLGDFLAVPFLLSTVLAGLLGGLIFLLRKRTYLNIWQVAVIAIGMELLRMGLILAMGRPFSDALAVVKSVVLPTTIVNAIGAGIFAYMFLNLVNEKKTQAEKELYSHELERKKFELESARQIQVSFMPESTPILKEFQIGAFSVPALEVGGDYYDFIPISEGKWGLVIGDVSGKGFPAALFMALSRTCVRSNAMGDDTASGSIVKANRIIAHDSSSGMFITLFYSVLDLKSKKLHYVNAGHNPPIVLNGKGGNIKLLGAKGIALGVIDDIVLEEVELDLAPNDIVIFYTDGVTEAINRKEEQFGQPRLIDVITKNNHLSAKDLVDKIKNDIVDFTQGEPQFDDLTLFALKVLPDPDSPAVQK
jgi:phosphoserine phosphatase RsbU/P